TFDVALHSWHILLISPSHFLLYFFFNDTATTEIYTLSLHDALPICTHRSGSDRSITTPSSNTGGVRRCSGTWNAPASAASGACRSEEHTSELQSRRDLVCRLLLEKKKKNSKQPHDINSYETLTDRRQ